MRCNSDIMFPEYSAYLSAMLGFLVFYGLETLVARPHQVAGMKQRVQTPLFCSNKSFPPTAPGGG